MEILVNRKVPTGNILVVQGESGKLECLSIGDYGKENNIKADFLGLTGEINGVSHSSLLPLEEKWVATISSQYGCSMGCTFCDCPKVGRGINASKADMVNQVKTIISLHPEVKYTDRLNIHFARMGEPTWNPSVIDATIELDVLLSKLNFKMHPVVSTMMPRNNGFLYTFISEWMVIKNTLLHGNAGLQLSINSTDESERQLMFSGNALTLEDVSKMMSYMPKPIGRKITLNFALSNYTINAQTLAKYFNPDQYICKITPMHVTKACVKNNLLTENGYSSFYPYKKVEEDLKSVGFDVIVFVPSEEEDYSKITCGNAILSEEK